jgi:hypothetical protein
MSDPRENKSYSATLNLSIDIDEFYFSSGRQYYEFEVSGDFSRDWDDLEKEAARQFMEENNATFEDMDLQIEVVNIRKI